jgi:hypothetical protein
LGGPPINGADNPAIAVWNGCTPNWNGRGGQSLLYAGACIGELSLQLPKVTRKTKRLIDAHADIIHSSADEIAYLHMGLG